MAKKHIQEVNEVNCEACIRCEMDTFIETFDALPLDKQMPMLLEAWLGRFANETFVAHQLMALTGDCAQRYLAAHGTPGKHGKAKLRVAA